MHTFPYPYFSIWSQYSKYKSSYCAQATIEGLRIIVRDFLRFISDNKIEMGKLTPDDVQSYVESKRHLKPRSLRTHLNGIVDFLRFCESCYLCPFKIHTTVIRPTIWKDDTIPSTIPWALICKLPDVAVPKERCRLRNRAILLLIITYGFRSGEVCNLRTKDIDWEGNRLNVTRTKNYTQCRYPLDVEVGNTILKYIMSERKNNGVGLLFQSARDSTQGIKSHSIWNLLNARLRILGYHTSGHHGPHAIRHSVAQRLLEKGCSYKEIRDQLGHKTLASTTIYAKINFQQLKKAALENISELLTMEEMSLSRNIKMPLKTPNILSITNLKDLL